MCCEEAGSGDALVSLVLASSQHKAAPTDKRIAVKRGNDLPTPKATPASMRGYHDRALRKEDDTRKVARYIVAQPLR